MGLRCVWIGVVYRLCSGPGMSLFFCVGRGLLCRYYVAVGLLHCVLCGLCCCTVNGLVFTVRGWFMYVMLYLLPLRYFVVSALLCIVFSVSYACVVTLHVRVVCVVRQERRCTTQTTRTCSVTTHAYDTENTTHNNALTTKYLKGSRYNITYINQPRTVNTKPLTVQQQSPHRTQCNKPTAT